MTKREILWEITKGINMGLVLVALMALLFYPAFQYGKFKGENACLEDRASKVRGTP